MKSSLNDPGIIEREFAPKPTATTAPILHRDNRSGLAEAVAHLSDSRAADYGQWVEVGMAIKGGGGTFDLFDQFSRRSAKFKEGEPAKKWDSFTEHGLGAGSIFLWAKQDSGWMPDKNGRQKTSAKSANTAIAVTNQPTDASKFLTDAGNAERFARANRGVLLFSAERGAWLVQNGQRYQWDDVVAVRKLAVDCALDLLVEARNCDDPDRREKLIKFALESQNKKRIDAMIDLARPLLAVRLTDLDIDGWKLNVTNGTIDLRTLELLPHNPADRITKICGTNYDPAATCPLWERFIARALPDSELARFVQRFGGMCLTADISEQIFPIFRGVGANGKSVFLDTFMGILGDYAGLALESLISVRRNPEHQCELAVLAGKRFVAASESEAESTLRLQLVKRVTGDAKLTARFMYGNPFEFPRTFKLVLVTNHLPMVKPSEQNEATWRRVRVILWDVVIPEAERDPRLLTKLRNEWPGILAWFVRGCADWQSNGLGFPNAVKLATAAYRQDQDTFGQFLDDCCIQGPKTQILSSELYAAYKEYCESAGIDPASQKALADPLRLRGFTEGLCTYSRKKLWKGIGLKA